ncbi:MAG: hypothetical protein KKE94_02015 [Gammaproteobacteria bacterium]|nr:hypothetical protein [Gammaproteobacteria bacterium]
MKKDAFVLLALLASMAQPVLAARAAKPAPVNQFGAAVMLQNGRINYQQDELQQQRTSQQYVDVSARSKAVLLSKDKLHTATFNTELHQVFENFSLGQGIGVNGLLHGDYNSDGVPELVLANPTSIVFAGTKQGQFSLQQKLSFESGIGKLVYFRDLSADGHFAFFSANNKLQKLDLISRKLVASLDIDSISSYQLVNTTDTQAAVLVLTSYDGDALVVNPLTLQVLRRQSGVNAEIATIGAFTTPGQAQVLFKNGKIYNLANNSLTLEKTLVANNATVSYAVDVNDDGLAELLSAESWYTIKLTSPLTEEVLWTKQADLDINALILADVNEDGKLDAVYGDGQWGGLHAFELQTGEDFWSINNPEHGVTNIVIGDLDNDGSQDIGWGAGYSSSGADYFFIHDLSSKQLKWQSEDIGFPTAAVSLVDIDQDGDLDAVTVSLSSNSGYDGGVIQAFDIQSNTRLWHGIAANNWGNTMKMVAADLDNDAKTELVIGSSEIYTGLVRVLNAADGSERFKKLLGDGDNISGLLVTDLNADGVSEIIVGNGAEHTGSGGAFFTVLNGLTGDIVQQSPSLGFHWQGLTDLHALNSQDSQFIYGLLGNNLYQYNYSNNTVRQLTDNAQFQQLTTVVTGGETSLLASDYDGNLLLLSAEGEVSQTSNVCQSNISGLSSATADTVLYNCNDSLGEYNLVTNSNNFVQSVGFNTTGDPQSVRHNGKELYIVGGSKVVVYQTDAPAPLPAPDDVSLSSHVLKAVTGSLQLPIEVDYFVIASSAKLGQLSFTDRKSGQFSYQPNGAVGTETLKFYAVKGNTSSAEAELSITLTNSAPVAENLNISTHWNSTLQITLSAQDADDETLQFELQSQPAHGQLQMLDAELGTLSYQPSGSSLDAVSFSFTAKDSLATSAQKSVIISLTNTAPAALANSYTTSYQTPVNGALQGSDADADAIAYEIVSQPGAGRLSLDSNTGLFVYTPAGNTDQTVSFSYIVKDKFASSAAQTVTINVKGETKTSSGGSLGFFSGFAVLLLALRRRYR